LPGSSVIQGLCQPGPLHVAAHLQMGLPPPLPQAEDLDHQPRYFGRYNKSRQDHWVLGDRASGAYMPKLAWTKIVRHPLIRGRASPDDPAQASYWAERRRKSRPLLDPSTLSLLRRQNGRCPLCGDLLLHADREPQSPHEWEQWYR